METALKFVALLVEAGIIQSMADFFVTLARPGRARGWTWPTWCDGCRRAWMARPATRQRRKLKSAGGISMATDKLKPRAMIGDAPVWCAHDALVPLAELKPNPRNPNQHPQRQIDKLAKIIAGNGWRTPITVSNRSGLITRGHGRLLAARALGLAEVPVDYQEYASQAAEWADVVADNKIAELAEMDDDLLFGVMEEIKLDDSFDVNLTGFDLTEIDDFLADHDTHASPQLSDPDYIPDKDNKMSISITFMAQDRPEMIKELKGLGKRFKRFAYYV